MKLPDFDAGGDVVGNVVGAGTNAITGLLSAVKSVNLPAPGSKGVMAAGGIAAAAVAAGGLALGWPVLLGSAAVATAITDEAADTPITAAVTDVVDGKITDNMIPIAFGAFVLWLALYESK